MKPFPSKRFFWLLIPLSLAVVFWWVGAKSPLFEGRRWLAEQEEKATTMTIRQPCTINMANGCTKASDAVLMTTDRAEIREMLRLLGGPKCVGPLNGSSVLPANIGMGDFYVTLSYRDGHRELLAVDSNHLRTEVVHLRSFDNRDSAVGMAKNSVDAYFEFKKAFVRMWVKRVDKKLAVEERGKEY